MQESGEISDQTTVSHDPDGVVGNEQWADAEGVSGPDPAHWRTETEENGRSVSVPMPEPENTTERADEGQPVGPHDAYWKEGVDENGRPTSEPVEG